MLKRMLTAMITATCLGLLPAAAASATTQPGRHDPGHWAREGSLSISCGPQPLDTQTLADSAGPTRFDLMSRDPRGSCSLPLIEPRLLRR